jgi:acyl carrier protein
MLNDERAFNIVKKAIQENDPDIKDDKINLKAKLMDDLGFDSLEIVEICIEIEDLADDFAEIEVDEKQVKFNKVTVGDLVTQLTTALNEIQANS